jgi:predicted TIM-barrel fold metal-dependent hydrolase
MTSPLLRVDAHAHVFRRSMKPIAEARYAPAYDAPLASYLRFLDESELDRGVLVQPSFLGSDNSFLLKCLQAASGRLAGIVVAEDALSTETAEEMKSAGVVGIRFNLLGRSADVLGERSVRRNTTLAARLGWQIELHADAMMLKEALPLLSAFNGPIVIDHFGRPGPGEMDTVLRWSDDPRIHLKLSAPYRVGFDDIPALAARLSDVYGTERLVWGSDWPWTQFEATTRVDLITPGAFGIEPAIRAAIDRTAMRLFFPGSVASLSGRTPQRSGTK